jgi:hypothetical protein
MIRRRGFTAEDAENTEKNEGPWFKFGSPHFLVFIDSDASPHPPPSEESESCPKIGIIHFSWGKSHK